MSGKSVMELDAYLKIQLIKASISKAYRAYLHLGLSLVKTSDKNISKKF
jgi:hypothetical protein